MKPISLVGDNVIAEMCKMASTVPDGPFVEVGVYKGGTAWHLNEICKEQGRELFLFDTFAGIPYRNEEKGDSHQIGDFGDTSKEAVQAAIPEATIIQGVFPAGDVLQDRRDIAFVHLDCDQYDSYLSAILYLWPRMKVGGVMWFDDYCLDGARHAIDSIFGHRVQGATCGKHFVRI